MSDDEDEYEVQGAGVPLDSPALSIHPEKVWMTKEFRAPDGSIYKIIRLSDKLDHGVRNAILGENL